MVDHHAVFQRLCAHVRETAAYESIHAALEWDERTLMPPAAGAYRAEQITLLSGLIHKRRTDPQLGEWIEHLRHTPLAHDQHSDVGCTLLELKRDYDKRIKLPQTLVEELSRASILGQQAWVEARKANDFKSFAPHLRKILHLKQQQAEAVGYQESPYDALLDDFEPGEQTAHVQRVLAALREELVPLITAIANSSRRAPLEILQRSFPISAQEAFGRMAAERIGFEFNRGRLDVTHHPFCTHLGPHDCRITTRYDEFWFPGSLFGILHEAGHGIYDQGLRAEWFGLPLGTYVSLGIHESQSRMWENMVGRSRAFWNHFYPDAQRYFPEPLRGVSPDDFYFAINDVQPSLIRVEADEATYNLHIIVRFELEQELLSGNLPVDELPSAWNERYQTYLGIAPPQDADGVLQDIHWSAALIGYFPTYSLGNLYAAQFFEQADQELGGLAELFARGEFLPLREWLRKNIHDHGKRFHAPELVERVTGKRLTHEPLLRYLRHKLQPLYELS